MAKITLVYFDLNTGYYPSFHHGLAYIIGALKHENHKVFLIHLKNENDFDKSIRFLEKEKPDLIGLSFATNQKKYVRRFFENGNLPARLIIAGGTHCTVAKDEVFKDFPQLDGICVGEGENPLKELCRRLDANEDFLTTPSFYFKTHEEVIKNPISPLTGIETLALPDYSLFDYQKIIEDSGGSFPMMLSRGCPYSCYYCCNHVFHQIYPNKEMYVRFPPIDHSIQIIKNNLSLYPQTKKIMFADDTFTLNKKWLFEFCEEYKKEIDLPFLCNARVETIDDKVIQYLKLAGCVSLDFGVESGNEWLRKHILNRKHSNKIIKEAFNITKKYGIKRFSFNIVGLPFEPKKMARDTLNLNLELRPNFGKCFYFYPYPGTRLYQLCKDYDLLLENIESVSGYLESPSIKEVFMTHIEIKRHFELMQMFFYSRLIFSKIRLPFLLEKLLLEIVFFLKKPLLIFLDPTSNNRIIKGLRKTMRKIAMIYLR